MEIEIEIGTGLDWTGLGLAGPDRTGLSDCLDRSGLDWTGLEPCGWAGLGWDLAAWRPRDLEKAEQHPYASKHTTNSSHRIKMDAC
jgi:hypothetical protein